MPRSLSLLYVAPAFGSRDDEPVRRKCISPLQGFGIEGATLTQAVGLGCDRSPRWGLRRIQMRAFCHDVAENGHAANKDDENVETPRVGQALPLHRLGRQSRTLPMGHKCRNSRGRASPTPTSPGAAEPHSAHGTQM